MMLYIMKTNSHKLIDMAFYFSFLIYHNLISPNSYVRPMSFYQNCCLYHVTGRPIGLGSHDTKFKCYNNMYSKCFISHD